MIDKRGSEYDFDPFDPFLHLLVKQHACEATCLRSSLLAVAVTSE
jgi:hypothetical protein